MSIRRKGRVLSVTKIPVALDNNCLLPATLENVGICLDEPLSLFAYGMHFAKLNEICTCFLDNYLKRTYVSNGRLINNLARCGP